MTMRIQVNSRKRDAHSLKTVLTIHIVTPVITKNIAVGALLYHQAVPHLGEAVVFDPASSGPLTDNNSVTLTTASVKPKLRIVHIAGGDGNLGAG